MKVRMRFPHDGINKHSTTTFDNIKYDPATMSLDAYIARLQTHSVHYGNRTYKPTKAFFVATQGNAYATFDIVMEEVNDE